MPTDGAGNGNAGRPGNRNDDALEDETGERVTHQRVTDGHEADVPERVAFLIRSATRVRILDALAGDGPRDRLELRDRLDVVRTTLTRNLDPLLDTGRCRVRIADRTPPYFLGIFDGRVRIGVADERGVPQALDEFRSHRPRSCLARPCEGCTPVQQVGRNGPRPTFLARPAGWTVPARDGVRADRWGRTDRWRDLPDPSGPRSRPATGAVTGPGVPVDPRLPTGRGRSPATRSRRRRETAPSLRGETRSSGDAAGGEGEGITGGGGLPSYGSRPSSGRSRLATGRRLNGVDRATGPGSRPERTKTALAHSPPT